MWWVTGYKQYAAKTPGFSRGERHRYSLLIPHYSRLRIWEINKPNAEMKTIELKQKDTPIN
jgi:hypothetical protein